nr:hypothetical protein [Tanacetum cinerariifolium]
QTRIEKLESKVERLEEENRELKELKNHQEKVPSMLDVNDKEPADVEEVLEVVKAAKLITEVVTAAAATKVSVSRKRRGVIIQDPEETTTTVTMQAQIELDEEVARQLKVELNADINWNDVIKQVKWSKRLTDAVMKYQALKRKPLTEAQARRNMIVYLKNMADEVHEGVKVPKKEVRKEKEIKVESSKREGESLEQEIAKKQKMEQEAKELKKHLQIVPNDDDVHTDATPLASKIPIVDYKIYTKRNRPYFKIIKADGNHMLFMSFITMMKNFDREDLEYLWKIVRERFKKIKPKNCLDDYLLNTLKIMFEKPNVEASVWKDQKGKYGLTKVKS